MMSVPVLGVLLCPLKLAALRTNVAQSVTLVAANLTTLGSIKTLRGRALGRRLSRRPHGRSQNNMRGG